MAHYRANVNHYSNVCFCHFDNEERMFEWISEKIWQKVSSFEECEAWTREQESSYIEILVIDNLKTFFINRRDYVFVISKLQDLSNRLIKMPLSKRRDILLNRFSIAYDIADKMKEISPEIWQGEI